MACNSEGGSGHMDGTSKATVDTRLVNLETLFSSIHLDLAEIRGRLSHMPTLWGIAGVMLGINAGIVAVVALAISAVKVLK
jgi:hypothetical protein